MFSYIENIDELLKQSAQFTMDQIYQQYKKKLNKQNRDISIEEFRQLADIDPTYEGGQEQGSYTHWVFNQFLNDPKILTEDNEKLNKHLSVFDKIKNRLDQKDINQYKSDADLFDAVGPYLDEDIRSKREKRKVETEDYDIEYEDEDWTVYKPNTWESSVMLGRGSNWCTAADSEYGEGHFESYTSEGPLYIVINNVNPNLKYQFHFESNSFMDKSDRDIDLAYTLQEEFSLGLRGWFWDKLDIDVSGVEVEGRISYDLIDYYSYNDNESVGYVPTDIMYNVFKDGPNFYKDYDVEDLSGALDIYPEDNINMEKFDYNLARSILVELFQVELGHAEENYGILTVNLFPEEDRYMVYLDEEYLLNYFLREVLEEKSIDYADLVNVDLVPYKIDPISTEDFKQIYKWKVAIRTEKELQEIGQLELFDEDTYKQEVESNEIYANIKNINELLKIAEPQKYKQPNLPISDEGWVKDNNSDEIDPALYKSTDKDKKKEVCAGIRNLDDLLKKFGDESMKATSEMKEFYDKRTKHHIDLVKKYCKKIHDIYDDRFEGIIERGEAHDESKWSEPELEAYIYITWDYKCKDEGVDFQLPKRIRDMMNDATEHHVNSNQHHPEFHCKEKGKINREDRDANPDELIDATSMNDLDIAEMCADFCAMSEEKGNSPIDWVDAKIGTRWGFNDNAVKLIYELLDNIWE